MIALWQSYALMGVLMDESTDKILSFVTICVILLVIEFCGIAFNYSKTSWFVALSVATFVSAALALSWPGQRNRARTIVVISLFVATAGLILAANW